MGELPEAGSWHIFRGCVPCTKRGAGTKEGLTKCAMRGGVHE